MTRFGKSIEAITFPTPSKCATCYATDAGSLNSHEAVKIDNMPCNDTNVNAATQMCAFFQCLFNAVQVRKMSVVNCGCVAHLTVQVYQTVGEVVQPQQVEKHQQ